MKKVINCLFSAVLLADALLLSSCSPDDSPEAMETESDPETENHVKTAQETESVVQPSGTAGSRESL